MLLRPFARDELRRSSWFRPLNLEIFVGVLVENFTEREEVVLARACLRNRKSIPSGRKINYRHRLATVRDITPAVRSPIRNPLRRG